MTQTAEVTPGYHPDVKVPVSPNGEIVDLNGEIARLIRREQNERNAKGKRRGPNFSERERKLEKRWRELKAAAHLRKNGEKVEMPEVDALNDAAGKMAEGDFDAAIELARSARGQQPQDPFPVLVLRELLKNQFAHDVNASLTRVTRQGQLHEIAARDRIVQQAGGAKQRRLF